MPLFAHAGRGLEFPSEQTRSDISDVLMLSLGFLPDGYNLHPRTRHERRRNKALMRDWHPGLLRLPIVPIGKEF